MIELMFLACLNASVVECRRESLLFTELPLAACMMRGQTQLADWTATHPGWTVARWSCRPHDPTRKDA
ncbi:hypothetical protein [uncultured Jannaschia sp.]|uniref:hypothetical protein n=1 Tax=uncultured Jannaschia sp. TaxID=293347 RepID=UPI0026347778|nr:hypothetical protein [uncultured Jannaschia sp.]